jgi:hypothetical protein
MIKQKLKLGLKKTIVSNLNAITGGGKDITYIDSDWFVCTDPNPYRTILGNGTCALDCDTATFTQGGVTC